MNDRIFSCLYWPALALAWFDVGLVAASAFHLPVILVQTTLAFTTALAVVFFILMLLDSPTRRAVNEANRLMREKSLGKLMGPSLLDPEWGLVGSIWRDRRLMWCNRALFVECIVALILAGGGPHPTLGLLLAFAGFFMTMVIFFLQLKNTPPLTAVAQASHE
jgi:hypothetical protein